MADQAAQKPPLRHPAEIPTFIVMVVLNVAILAILIDFLVSAALIPPALRGTNWELTIRAVAGAMGAGGSGAPDRPGGHRRPGTPRQGRRVAPVAYGFSSTWTSSSARSAFRTAMLASASAT